MGECVRVCVIMYESTMARGFTPQFFDDIFPTDSLPSPSSAPHPVRSLPRPRRGPDYQRWM